jgi:hypothetical protein
MPIGSILRLCCNLGNLGNLASYIRGRASKCELRTHKRRGRGFAPAVGFRKQLGEVAQRLSSTWNIHVLIFHRLHPKHAYRSICASARVKDRIAVMAKGNNHSSPASSPDGFDLLSILHDQIISQDTLSGQAELCLAMKPAYELSRGQWQALLVKLPRSIRYEMYKLHEAGALLNLQVYASGCGRMLACREVFGRCVACMDLSLRRCRHQGALDAKLYSLWTRFKRQQGTK